MQKFQESYIKASKLPLKHILITALLCILAMHLLFPSKTETKTNIIVKTVYDSIGVKKAIAERDAITNDNESLLSEIFRLQQRAMPVSGEVSKPAESPIQPTPPVTINTNSSDTTKPKAPELFSYDFPIAGWITKNQIKFLCVNPFLKYVGEPYTKTYVYDRRTSDFEFALTPTNESTTLQGIALNYKQRFFSFDGFWIGTEAALPKDIALYGEFDFSFYEQLSLSARFTTDPGLAVCLAWRIF